MVIKYDHKVMYDDGFVVSVPERGSFRKGGVLETYHDAQGTSYIRFLPNPKQLHWEEAREAFQMGGHALPQELRPSLETMLRNCSVCAVVRNIQV
jgi:hypothetical protein